MNIDTETGLPELPEGMRWKVASHRDPFYGSGQTCIYLQASYHSIFGKTKWYDYMSDSIVKVDATGIWHAAQRVMERWNDEIEKKRFLGVYPPKSL